MASKTLSGITRRLGPIDKEAFTRQYKSSQWVLKLIKQELTRKIDKLVIEDEEYLTIEEMLLNHGERKALRDLIKLLPEEVTDGEG